MKLNQNGSIVQYLPLIIAVVLLIASIIFGSWAYSSKQKYKNNADQLISSAVALAKQQQNTNDEHQFALEQEQPLLTYNGPEAYGSLIVQYPRTWSAYVNSTGGNGYPVDGYFYPGILPSASDVVSVNFALRIQVENSSYSNTLQQYTGLQLAGEVTVSPYSLPKVPNVIGVEVVGTLLGGKTGTMVILPLRSTALEVWTEGTQYLADFNNNILPNITFSP